MVEIQEMKRKVQALQSEQQQLELALAKNADADKRLIVNACRGSYKWYVKEGDEKYYLPKSQREYAVKLAKVAWQKARLAEVRTEMQACERYIHSFRSETSHMQQILENKGYCSLLGLENPNVEEWMKEKYLQNQAHPEHLKFPTNTGVLVRSKSEALIAMQLEKFGIPYRYECQLQTPVGPIYPDFTIKHPKTRRLYIWEHFGLMDDPNYAASAGKKTGIYMQMGYIPGDTFLATYESGTLQLDLYEVERIIQEKFVQE